MKLVSWCKPPLKNAYNIPNIPEEYKIFGIKYPNKNLTIDNIKDLVKESYNKFLLLLETSDEKFIEDIENIHLKINEVLNENKKLEVTSKLKEIKNETIKQKLDILKDLKNKTECDI